MFGLNYWSNFCCQDDEYQQVFAAAEFDTLNRQPFSMPAPLPRWPPDEGFANGNINLGSLVVSLVTNFERVCSMKKHLSRKKTTRGVSFYKPMNIPDGFFSLGYYCQRDNRPLRPYLLVVAARDLDSGSYPALVKPLSYSLICSFDCYNDECGYIWLPIAPVGYKSLGFVVTTKSDEPEVEEIRCVRSDLTEKCEASDLLVRQDMIRVWNTRPCKRGMFGKGVPVGTFFCSCKSVGTMLFGGLSTDSEIACLKNLDSSFGSMPKLNQIHELIAHYGPTVFFHPDESFMPSSVSWFFKNGALLYKNGKDKGLAIDSRGTNLPKGGINDGEFWLNLPEDDEDRTRLKAGDIDTAQLYLHVKPALGASFTDIAMWVFCPFNGPATIKAGLFTIPLDRVGEHVGDWEHFTLRISNFTGELWSIYFSEHSGGEWVDASELEFIENSNKPIVYSSKNGHASFPHAGCYIQGSSIFGLRNDCAKSKYCIDSSTRYQIVAAEYLGKGVVSEPNWLQYMREWGPMIVYNSRTEADKIINHLPFFVRFTVESLFEIFPTELYGEEGPTGPKEKDNWILDERC